MFTAEAHAPSCSQPPETLIADVLAVARRLGRPPKAREYGAQGRYSYLALTGRLGGWKKVRRVVAEKLWIESIKSKQQREYFPRNETIKRVARDATCAECRRPLSDFAMSGLAKSSALTAVHCRRPIEQLFP